MSPPGQLQLGPSSLGPGTPVPPPPRPPEPLPGYAPITAGVFGPDTGPRAQRALTIAALMRRIALGAGPTPARWSTYPADDLTPEKIVAARREAHAGYPLQWCDLCTEVLERNAHMRSVFHQRRSWIFSVPYRIDPPEQFKGDPLARNIAAWVGAALANLRSSWVDLIYNLLSASAYGWSAAEVFWQYKTVSFTDENGLRVETPGALVPVMAVPVGQKHFRFGLDTDEPLLWTGQGSAGQRWAHGKILFHRALGDGFIERRGWMTAGVWMDLATQQGWTTLVTFAKLYGLPQLAAFVEKHVLDQAGEREKVDEMLSAWAQGLIPVFVDDVDVKQVGTTTGEGQVHQSIIELAEREISKLVVGATLQHDQGGQIGSYGMSGTHESTSHMYVLPDGEGLARTFEADLHHPLVERNLALLCRRFRAYPDQVRARVPWGGWKAASREPNAADWLAIFKDAATIKFPVSIDQVSKVLGLTVATGTDILGGALEMPPPGLPGAAPRPALPGHQGPTAPSMQPPKPAAAPHAPHAPHAFEMEDGRAADPGVMVALYPPAGLARELALPNGEAPEELHVTLAYLGRRSALRVSTEALEGALATVEGRVLEGRIGGVGRFSASETSDGQDVLYASVDVPGLEGLREAVCRVLELAGATPAAAHGFTPHMTLAYVAPDAENPLLRLEPRPVQFTEIHLVVGEERVAFPLKERP